MKSDQATVRKRVEEVLQLRLLGAEFTDIRQHASAQAWGVSDRQLWRYVAKGDKILAKTLEQDREKLLNRHIAQRRALYARAMAVSDYRTALATLRDDAELLGLYPPKRSEHTGKDGRPIEVTNVSDIERREFFAKFGEVLAPFPAAKAAVEELLWPTIEADKAKATPSSS